MRPAKTVSPFGGLVAATSKLKTGWDRLVMTCRATDVDKVRALLSWNVVIQPANERDLDGHAYVHRGMLVALAAL